ncbi:Major intrinsic protein family and Aquaporin-like domain-containing protein [Strongyloides ratti]|uniref:Major intrinsic protein family and Aquaporin-like domain-containing protein n=1 Tax=Strongyloides ratti TaxID=34506 RepID=A0A090LHV9_STRRB|nr:Major intrinsic protein family and Aquaporin-like domain-containing protein [Strongyloides ratti]CEF69327.1 Major intrinsic protein family and Aquaporin-like domain-containing protein [Strongyloides ratti]
MTSIQSTIADKLHTDQVTVREILAEFIATLFFVMIGTAANVQFASTGGSNMVVIPIAWGIGFAFSVYLASAVSGAHINPAISVAQAILGNLSFAKLPHYILSQLVGAFMGTLITYTSKYDDIQKISRMFGNNTYAGDIQVAGLFTTFPAPHMTAFGSFFDQLIGTAILSGCICLITDRRHHIHQGVVPALAGGIMAMIALTYGTNGGFAINPARDFGPRFFTWIVGYGSKVFSYGNYYFWIPIVGPFIGALIGAWIYKLFVGLHGLSEVLEITNPKSILP